MSHPDVHPNVHPTCSMRNSDSPAILDASTAIALARFCEAHALSPAEFISYAVKLQLGACVADPVMSRYTARDARRRSSSVTGIPATG